MATTTAPLADTRQTAALQSVLADLARFPQIEVRHPSEDTLDYLHDAATRGARVGADSGPAVAFPTSADEVQQLVRAASAHGVTVVPRGAGSGLSGGASADTAQLVISTERLDRIIEISPLDEVAVVEPGVINADLNVARSSPSACSTRPTRPASRSARSAATSPPTPAACAAPSTASPANRFSRSTSSSPTAASSRSDTARSRASPGSTWSRCSSARRACSASSCAPRVRLRPLPVARRTITAFFDSTDAGTRGLGAITLSPVRPAVIEFFDEPSLRRHRRVLAARPCGSAAARCILIELDGYGIDEQTADLSAALTRVGARVSVERREPMPPPSGTSAATAGASPADRWFIGEDIAVPKSRLPEIYAALPRARGPLRRRASRPSRTPATATCIRSSPGRRHPATTRSPPAELQDAATELVRIALALGGTVTGEHGVGTVKLDWSALELSQRSLDAQHAVKAALDPRPDPQSGQGHLPGTSGADRHRPRPASPHSCITHTIQGDPHIMTATRPIRRRAAHHAAALAIAATASLLPAPRAAARAASDTAGASGEPKEGGNLTFLIQGYDAGWVPSKTAISSYEGNLWGQITDKLVYVDPKGTLSPWIAESWEELDGAKSSCCTSRRASPSPTATRSTPTPWSRTSTPGRRATPTRASRRWACSRRRTTSAPRPPTRPRSR